MRDETPKSSTVQLLEQLSSRVGIDDSARSVMRQAAHELDSHERPRERRVIITGTRVEIYRGALDFSPGGSCREFAIWMQAWAAKRLAESIGAGVEEPGAGGSVLCD